MASLAQHRQNQKATMGIKIGFGNASLWGSWSTNQPCLDDITVQAMVVRRDQEIVAALAVADVCSMLPATCQYLRQALAAALATPLNRIGIFCTQNHGAPMDDCGMFDLERWNGAFTQAALSASAAAVEAQMTYVSAAPTPARVINRRKIFADLGAFSFFFGFPTDAAGRAQCAALLQMALRSLISEKNGTVRHGPNHVPVPADRRDYPLPHVAAELTMDDAADPLIQGLFFRDLHGRPIGALARWAAHPVTANVPDGGHSGDYPLYARRHLEQVFGGRALFLTGPCGDQAPIVETKSIQMAQQIGRHVAHALLDQLADANWTVLQSARAASNDVTLPLGADLPATHADAQHALAQAKATLAELRRTHAPLPAIKVALERVERLAYFGTGTFNAWCGLTEQDWRAGCLRHPLFTLVLNDAGIVGLPGEPYGSFSSALRNAAGGQPLLVAEQCNGYLSYIPAAGEYARGGYGPAAAILAPGAERILLDAAERLLHTCRERMLRGEAARPIVVSPLRLSRDASSSWTS